MKQIDMVIECSSCKGSGVYVGMAEKDGAAVICHNCKGTGAFHYVFNYNDFTGRKSRADVKRVYLQSYGYVIAPKEIDFKGIGKIDMANEGVSYNDFLNGAMPGHIEKLACPMLADQGACHDIKGFTDECNKLHGGWVSYLPECKNRANMAECWKRFKIV